MGDRRDKKGLRDAQSVRDVTGSERCKRRDRYKRCEREGKYERRDRCKRCERDVKI
jgi:hypothetical protein